MIRKVALAGKGYVGGKIYDALVNAGFEVTILTRASGAAAAADPESSNPRTRAVDYSSTESLIEALLGQDAVVSALAPAAWEHHLKLLDAAIDAKVKHFIPSDYTSLSTFPEVADIPYWKELATVQQYLRDKAGSAGVKWTVLVSGPLLDCVLNGYYMYNFGEQTALVTSDGDLQVSMTTGPYLGKAIAKVLSKSEELESGSIYLHEVVTTQNELLKMAEKLSEREWPVQHVEADDTLQKGLGMVKASQGGTPNMFSWFLIIQGTIFSGKYKVEWDGSGNKLLDLPTMSKDKLEGLVETRVKGDVLYGGLPWNSAPKPRAK
ncbi:hypothetical protein KVR01_009102 [Diaporthe batatas]|uniref:uncharacterized protein n=1 Tax=Diaporthe batatas TaxID=748121 RepID=UPI001D043822|nr:uncharacterized protein KVR01_009102 [Diaporthe batatas]KAG8160838.1 hypothetical protein KVR01_009102 [Diaporthe batatas]